MRSADLHLTWRAAKGEQMRCACGQVCMVVDVMVQVNMMGSEVMWMRRSCWEKCCSREAGDEDD